MKKSLVWITAALAVVCIFTGCPTADGGSSDIPQVELVAGDPVSVADTATTATVTFIGASRLAADALTAADFTVAEGGVIGADVVVRENDVFVPVTFGKNTTATVKTYAVGIASASAKIKGSATVTITQSANDPRKELTAGDSVNPAYADTTATVTFTGATGLTLAATDFTVIEGEGVSLGVPTVTGDTVTVPVTFSANTTNTAKTYTVSTNPNSTNIKGTVTVTITQAADPRPVLAKGADVSNAAQAGGSVNVTFTGATGVTTLATTDFTVDNEATITSTTVSSGTVTVAVSIGENTTNAAKEYTVGIAPASTKIKGSATVKITQKTYADFTRPNGGTSYTLVRYVDYGQNNPGIVEVKPSTGGNITGLVNDPYLKKLFNAIYTPNKPDSTDSVLLDGQGKLPVTKETIRYTPEISAKALALFKITFGSTDKVEITGTDLPTALGASETKLIVIDIGVPDEVDNTGLPTFYIPATGFGEEENSYAHIRLRVNKGASLVILADNSDYTPSTPCPTGTFNYGCVEVMAGGKLRDGAFVGFPLGSNAVILNRLGSYLAIGPEPKSEDAQINQNTYDSYYKGWLIGPANEGDDRPRIKWDSGNNDPDYLEVREGKLALSANVTVQTSMGLIYSAWLIGNTTVTIDIPADYATEYGQSLFANNFAKKDGTSWTFYGTDTDAQIVIEAGSKLHKVFLTGDVSDEKVFIPTNEARTTITNNASENGGESFPEEQYTNDISGKAAWNIPSD